jgi:uncharacterized protein YbjQ (UPF0145 family)
VIEATCLGCGAQYTVDDSRAGKTAKCRRCSGVVTISGHSPSSPPPAASWRENVDDDGFVSEVQVATTDSIQGWTITKYHGLVTSHVVAGTGFFSDFAAGFTDVFGGRSDTYQRQMAAIEEEALVALKRSALGRGANWIVGLRIDFDEISGKGMQMFMVSAQGTAVQAIATPAPVSAGVMGGAASGVAVKNAIKRERALHLLSLLESGQREVSEESLFALTDARLAEAVPLLLEVAAAESITDASRSLAIQGLKSAPRAVVRQALQAMLLEQPQSRVANELYRDLGLLDPQWALKQMQSESRQAQCTALRVLRRCVASSYTRDDIPTLRALADIIPDTFRETCTFHEVKGILGGKPTPSWRCENGHSNPNTESRCSQCDIDRHGLPRWVGDPPDALRSVTATLELLEQHFSRSINRTE